MTDIGFALVHSDDDQTVRLNLGPLRRESQFRLALALANVGTFGNLRPRERISMDSMTY